jgi:hypothetical protein
MLGDSTLWKLGKAYAQLIEKDVRVKVVIEDYVVGGLTIGEVLNVLKNEEPIHSDLRDLPSAISDAEVVVYHVGYEEGSFIPENRLDAAACMNGLTGYLSGDPPTKEHTLSTVYIPMILGTPSPNIFGLMIPMDKLGRQAAAELHPKYFRNIVAVYANEPLYCSGCEAAATDGYQLVITINAKADGSPPDDLVGYESFINDLIVEYNPWGIVIENEETLVSQYSGTAEQYAEQLEVACGVAEAAGVKCMNGGIAMKAVLLMIWYYTYGGYPNPNACTFAEEAFNETDAAELCNGASDKIYSYITKSKGFYDVYGASDIDYVNLHFYVEPTMMGTNVSVLDDAIYFMQDTGKPTLINEWGLRVDDHNILELMMSDLRKYVDVAIYMSPYPSAAYDVFELQNDDGTLTGMGEHFRDYIVNNKLY